MVGVTGKIPELNELARFIGRNCSRQVHAFESFGEPVRTSSVLDKHRINVDSHIRSAPTLHPRVRLHGVDELDFAYEAGFLYMTKELPEVPKMAENGVVLADLDVLRTLDLSVCPVYYFGNVIAVKVV